MLTVPADGPPIAGEQDALDLIGEAFGEQAEMVVIPAGRLGPDFFRLSTRLAGEITQKFVNYRLRLVVMGDIAAHVAGSTALRDYVYEANQGSHLWFVADEAELAGRLA
ncbi:DUF4180 domain-containing protein [Nonomuraea sp. NPDC050663]|uniref:DUF4180 domain-containing protein n=1 Tax=Nonomuraea sp. NPDC050663 TaxID=3364370 RepID=UPI0037B4A51F